jgi:hypothetical protein
MVRSDKKIVIQTILFYIIFLTDGIAENIPYHVFRGNLCESFPITTHVLSFQFLESLLSIVRT